MKQGKIYSKNIINWMFILKAILFFFVIAYFIYYLKLFKNKNLMKESYVNEEEPSKHYDENGEVLKNVIGPFNFKQYGELMMENENRKLIRPRFTKDIPIETEDCNSKCDERACIQMEEKRRILNECLKCNAQKNKCYAKSIIGGVCNDCDDSEITGKIDCLNVLNFGCINPYNIDSNNGVEPYFIQMPSDTVTSPFDTNCVFCWQLKDFV